MPNNFQKLTFDNKLKIIELFIMLLTVCSAVYIGIKQNNINNQLLNINYIPSLRTVLDGLNERILVTNTGQTPIYLNESIVIEDRFSNESFSIPEKSVLINSGDTHKYLVPEINAIIGQYIREATTTETIIPIKIFFKDAKKEEYILEEQIKIIKIAEEKYDTGLSTMPIIQQKWAKYAEKRGYDKRQKPGLRKFLEQYLQKIYSCFH